MRLVTHKMFPHGGDHLRGRHIVENALLHKPVVIVAAPKPRIAEHEAPVPADDMGKGQKIFYGIKRQGFVEVFERDPGHQSRALPAVRHGIPFR